MCRGERSVRGEAGYDPAEHMASLATDRGGRQGSALADAAAPNLQLAVRRIARLVGADRVAAVGPIRLDLGPDTAVVEARRIDADVVAASRDGVAVLSSRLPWSALAAARVVVAFDPDPAASALDALAAIEADAAEAGWRVAHASLLHTAGTGGSSIRREWPLVVACRPGDDAMAQALANGPLSLALDPLARTRAAAPGRAARVLIASYEIAGPTGNGGIGTAYHSLAHVLAGAGHDVTVLFTGWIDPERGAREAEWRRRFADHGIDFSFLGTPWDLPVRSPHHAVRRAYELHRWLADAHAAKPFDVVHLPETIGHGAFALTAKALGIDYHDVEFVVGTHSSTRWVAECNRETIESVDLLVTEQLERLSVERADVVLSPTAYLVDYMRDRGWALPERTFVQPLARPRSVRAEALSSARPASDGAAPDELVFFGRLETRKGLEVFCDAVDLLTADACPFARVTFLGRPERVMGEDANDFVARRAARWGIPWKVVPDFGHDEAIAYLQEHACVVAIPSLVDNSPNTVIEAIALGIPFVASRSGGTAELLAADDLAASTFDGWRASLALEPPTFADEEAAFDAAALASALRAKASDPSSTPAPSVGDADCDRAYDAWHRAVAARRDAQAAKAPAPRELPTAAACVVAPDARDAQRVIAALAAGTRRPAATVAICDAAPADGGLDGAQLTVASGRDSGPARRRAVAALEADIVIVLRANEEPDPDLVQRVCDAMAVGEADVLTLVSRDPDEGRDTGAPAHLRRADVPRDLRAFVPVAGPAVAEAAYPALAVGPYAIRRAALTRLGGFAEDVWGEACDRELLARAALAGLRVDVLPDPVATTVRDDRWVELRTRYWGDASVPAPEGEELVRILRPFRRRLDDELGDLAGLLVGGLRAAGRATEERAEHERMRQELVDAYEARIGEFRELVEIYERRIVEQDQLLAGGARSGRLGRLWRGRLGRGVRRATRGPVHTWPPRAMRFARWHFRLPRQ